MTSLNKKYKRSKPLLGTFFQVSLDLAPGSTLAEGFFSTFDTEVFADAIFAAAFEKAHNLEKIFSRFSNEPFERRENNQDFNLLLGLALDIQEKTDSVFRVRKDAGFSVDLDGISKGFIVDAVVEEILTLVSSKDFLRIFSESKVFGGVAPNGLFESLLVSGVVNAGGDMRFFNKVNSQIDLRLGNYDIPVLRKIETHFKAIATSSLTVSKNNAQSTTRYELPLRANLTSDHAAVVLADTCSVADALTKVALFGTPSTIQKACDQFKSEILIFDSFGEVAERYFHDETLLTENIIQDDQTLDLFSELIAP